jgi:tetratricopeptide (TPR) repeat protein
MADAPVREDDANPALAETAADVGRDAVRALQPGDRLGRYTILEIMGVGGMGVVYAAHDGDLDRKVAIKLLRASGDAELARARLLREARAMARLRHPNVITVYEAGEIDERVFVAMELVEGVTAGEWLAAPEQPRAWREVLDVFLAAGRGLAAAHAAGLVHRDFKPANVLLDRGGRVVVTDFGLARQAHPESATGGAIGGAAGGAEGGVDDAWTGADGPELDSASGGSGTDHSLTRTGTVLGTPAYMAPEQHRGSQADARSDQFSFSVALYEGLYGQRPFRGHSPATLHAAIVQGRIVAPPRGSRVARQVPQRLRRILLRGLRPRPDERFPSMPALLAALERVARRWPRALLAAGAALLVSVGVLLVALGTRADEPAAYDCAITLDGAWDDDVAGSIRAVLARAPQGSEAFAALAARLDAGRGAWLDARARICESERQAPDRWSFHRRMGCLLDYREQLAALTELVRAADAQAMDFAVSAADGLPDPAHCVGLTPAHPRLELAGDPARMAETERVRTELAQAAAAHQVAKLDRAIELGASALAGARALGDRRLEAAALLRLADSHAVKVEAPIAHRYLRELVLLAEEIDEVEILAQALTLQAILLAGEPNMDGGAVRDMVRRARIAVGRVREPGKLLGRLRLVDASERTAGGALDEAEVAYAEARQLHVDSGMELQAARVDLHWGLSQYRQGRFDESKETLERGLAVMRAQASAMSYEVVCLLDFAYQAAEILERYDEALRFYDISVRRCPRAIAPWELEPPGPSGPAASDVVGHVFDDTGYPVAGAEVIVRAGLLGNGRYALRSLERHEAFITRTAGDGSFTVPGKDVQGAALVVAETDGGRSFPVALQPGAGAGLTVSLRRFGSVRGQVERPARSEAAGAPMQPGVQASGQGTAQWIVFLPEAGPLPYRSSIQAPLRSDGSFAVERLPAGRYRVGLARHQFLLRSFMRATRWVPLGELEVAAGDARDVSFALPPEADTGAALENAAAPPAAGSALEVHVRNRFDGVIPHAHLMVFPGRTVPATIAEIDARWQGGDSALWFTEAAPDPGPVAAGDAGRAGLVHRFTGLPGGDLVVCAVPLGEQAPYRPELGYPPYLDVYCVTVSEAERAGARPVIIEAAPMRRRS